MMHAQESGSIPGLRLVVRSVVPLVVGLLLAHPPAWGGAWEDDDFSAWQAVGDDELNAVRGGFKFSNGVQIDIGIKKAAFVNGFEEFRDDFRQQFRTRLNVSEGVQSRILNEANSVLQVGVGSALDVVDTPSGSTFIQNTLDNQFLSNLTVVDVRIKNLDTVRQLPLSAFPAIQDFAIPGIAP